MQKTYANTVYETVALNKENLAGCEVMLSSAKTATMEDGTTYTYHWVTFTTPDGSDVICCTGKKFEALLGADANSTKLAEVIKANLNKFEIAHCTDQETGEYLFTDKSDMPLLKIQKRAERIALTF